MREKEDKVKEKAEELRKEKKLRGNVAERFKEMMNEYRKTKTKLDEADGLISALQEALNEESNQKTDAATKRK